jgi:CMP-N,N'-diacetyllegionaminic acid synthase
MNRNFLAIITARAGSKRLLNKNSLDLAGKPLIAWTIDAAKKTKYISEVVVSTDSLEIKKTAEEFRATVPFIRPEHLSNDTASSFDVVEHCIEFYQTQLNQSFDYIILLQPTSPLRTSADIENAIQLLNEKNADAVVSVCETEHSPLWSNTIDTTLSLEHFLRDEVKNKRSQDLPTYYRLNGAIYICKTEELLKQKTFFLKQKCFAYIMDKENSVDIDTALDFKMAEFLINDKIK